MQPPCGSLLVREDYYGTHPLLAIPILIQQPPDCYENGFEE